ncbi:Protein phosphatase 2C 2, partial [Spiromyces aspiralis]
MGQTLSEPITEKYTTHGEDSRYVYAASAMQGWRVNISEGENPGTNAPAFFAVFDGHGGQGSAIYAGKHLHHFIRKRPEFAEKKYDAAIKAGYLETDEHLRQSFSTVQDPSGCTAVSVVIPGDGKIYCGNAGDSRCVLSSGGKAIPLSMDHKPTNDIEYQRITQGGGFVEFGRVNGNLALSRAIGDFEFKNNPALSPEKQVVTADPDVSVHELSTDDQFFVVACDGIWDCMTNVEVTDMVRELVAAGVELTTVCEKIMERCLARESEFGGLGCDNMTI